MMKKTDLKLLTVICFLGLVTVVLPLNRVAAEELTEYDPAEVTNLHIKVGRADIEFVDGSDKIVLSSDLAVKEKGEKLEITSPQTDVYLNWSLLSRWRDDEQKYRILIGNEKDYSRLRFHLGGVNITGSIRAEEFDLTATGVDVDAQLFARKISMRGSGITTRGYFNTEQLYIRGLGVNVDLVLENSQQVNISGTGLNGLLRYRDIWTGDRDLSVSGLGGNIFVEIGEDLILTGNLNTSSRGVVGLEYDYWR